MVHGGLKEERKVEKTKSAELEKFSTDGNDLYVYGKKVIRGWESFSGWKLLLAN